MVDRLHARAKSRPVRKHQVQVQMAQPRDVEANQDLVILRFGYRLLHNLNQEVIPGVFKHSSKHRNRRHVVV